MTGVLTGTAVILARCAGCGGTGSPGTIGGYRINCMTCDGVGAVLAGYMAVRNR